MGRAYETTNGRYLDVNDRGGRDRKRARRCADDRAELTEQAGQLSCPACGRSAGEMAQVMS